MNAGELAGAGENGKPGAQRLLLLVTPRILVAEEESPGRPLSIPAAIGEK
jgi:hypothetical protein